MAVQVVSGARNDGWLERFTKQVASGPAGRLIDLLGSTFLTRPKTQSPFGDWKGVAAVLQSSKPLPVTVAPSFVQTAADTLTEIRENVASVLRSLNPTDGIDALKAKLKDFGLNLYEKKSVNYLHYEKTNTHHKASKVNPELSYFGTLRRSLQAKLAGQIGPGDPATAVHGWDEMAFTMGFSGVQPQDLVNDQGKPRNILGYSVSTEKGTDGKAVRRGWIGTVHAVASDDPAVNLKMMREAKAKGLELVLPERMRGDAAKGLLVRGMPILVKSKAGADGKRVPVSLPADKIHPMLSLARLTAAWGKGMIELYIEKADKANKQSGLFVAPSKSPFLHRDAARAERESRQSFFDTFVAKKGADDFAFAGGDAADDLFTAFADDKTKPAAGSKAADPVPEEPAAEDRRDFRVRVKEDRSGVYIWDAEFEAVQSAPVSELDPGRYPLEDSNGKKLGYTDVLPGKRVEHRSADTNETLKFNKPQPSRERRYEREDRFAARM
ncbi:hypothetical protein BB934_45295 (plasmid) [Microvirga ossetica]|uniref:Uncharacterized protein n=1 Tax=Microvirga ossetica TaxID=1882682 RepID=A0A1B2EZT2_9HYPH|nr:hypothetical protein [Microvirga ossetica]ANY85437.1 hypothetical protein BB934_45295 [Microvirga ossetica]